ncbi:YcfL family protein [Acinetobacter sp.]|uniref:YcfL family protein n=1 Tax=Acinetobacter sp. TaxID=472 RepID=UPI003D07A1F1
MKICLKLGAASFLAAALIGCTAPNSLSTQTAADGTYSVKTVSNNPKLVTQIAVDRISMGYAGDLKKASIAIKDRWFVSRNFEYKIVWVDANGFEVNPEGSRWKPIQLTGREIKTVQSIAPNPSAVDVVVYLRKD